MPAYSLCGKVALITGAERGIGFATAQELVGRGARVIVVDLDEAADALTVRPARASAAGVG